MAQKLISMSKKELFRYEVLRDLIANKTNGADASKQMGITIRHVKRLKVNVIKFGMAGLVHKSRGRKGNRKTNPKTLALIKKVLKEKYYDFQPTHVVEKLAEEHQIKTNKETIRQLMAEMGLWKIKPRKKGKIKHFWRPRKDNFGEMQQFDGSYYCWFGNFETCLLLAVDDASGKIAHAKFSYNEGIIAVFKFWLEYFDKNGAPISIYLDKFSAYRVNHKNATDNKDMITQFQRASNQIGVNLIFANTPQAKGRVERMNKTLQNRLVKELRLANITTIEQANEF